MAQGVTTPCKTTLWCLCIFSRPCALHSLSWSGCVFAGEPSQNRLSWWLCCHACQSEGGTGPPLVQRCVCAQHMYVRRVKVSGPTVHTVTSHFLHSSLVTDIIKLPPCWLPLPCTTYILYLHVCTYAKEQLLFPDCVMCVMLFAEQGPDITRKGKKQASKDGGTDLDTNFFVGTEVWCVCMHACVVLCVPMTEFR